MVHVCGHNRQDKYFNELKFFQGYVFLNIS